MIERIDSLTNKKVKLTASLKLRKHREKEGLFLAEGIRLAEMAAESMAEGRWRIAFGFFTEELRKQDRGQKLLEALEQQCVLYETTEAVYQKLTTTETSQGIILIMEMPTEKQKALPMVVSAEGKNPIYVILDGVQDPGNAGTIIRTADAAGADGVILTKGSVDVYSDKTVRSTMGSLFHLPIYQDVTHEELLDWTERADIQLYGTALDETAKPHFLQDFKRSCAIVLGNEGRGVSDTLLEKAKKTYIPMYGKAESLNVGMSAAIVLYEAVRQRNF